MVAALQSALAGNRPQIPEAGHDLWQIFCDLSAAREYTMAGAQPVSFSHIQSYARLYRWPLQPHHIDVIRAMDLAWLEYGRKPETKAKPDPTAKRSQQLTPELFDALF